MSIYSINQLLDKVANATVEQAHAMLIQILRLRHSEGTMMHLSRIIMGVEIIDNRKTWCQLSNRKVIPFKLLKDLAQSPMMDFIEDFIEAASSGYGPYQTRDIMMMAGANKKAFFITAEGIKGIHKTQCGYILQMAGFERRSHFDKVRRQPIKAWKTKDKRELSSEQRGQMVRSIIREELMGHVEVKPQTKKKAEAPLPSCLEDLI